MLKMSKQVGTKIRLRKHFNRRFIYKPEKNKIFERQHTIWVVSSIVQHLVSPVFIRTSTILLHDSLLSLVAVHVTGSNWQAPM